MPNNTQPLVRPAAPNTLCAFEYYGRTCGHDNGTPGVAVHVLTRSLPIAPVGTPLCGYHSPADVVRRWEVILAPDNPKAGSKVHTFTWGVTRMDAYERVTTLMDKGDMWDGWSFTLADTPTPGIYA